MFKIRQAVSVEFSWCLLWLLKPAKSLHSMYRTSFWRGVLKITKTWRHGKHVPWNTMKTPQWHYQEQDNPPKLLKLPKEAQEYLTSTGHLLSFYTVCICLSLFITPHAMWVLLFCLCVLAYWIWNERKARTSLDSMFLTGLSIERSRCSVGDRLISLSQPGVLKEDIN